MFQFVRKRNRIITQKMTKDIEGSVIFVSSHQLRNQTNKSKSESCDQGVLVRNAIKTYGVGKNQNAILQGFDMNVKKGTM